MRAVAEQPLQDAGRSARRRLHPVCLQAGAAVLGAAILCAQAQAGICNREPGLQAAILEAIAGGSLSSYPDCTNVSDEQLEDLTTLDATRRGIRTLERSDFNNLKNLTTLNLEYNLLEALPANAFAELGKLTFLNLERNRLEALPADAFGGLGKLTRLELNDNRLRSLSSDAFDGLGKLTTLDLRGNELESLPGGVLDDLDELETLDLAHNELTELPRSPFSGTDLRWVDLRHNELRNLPLKLFAGSHNLAGSDARVYLGNNPGAPFDLNVELLVSNPNTRRIKYTRWGNRDRHGSGWFISFGLHAPFGTPYDLTVPWSIAADTGAISPSFDPDTETIAAGGTHSDPDEIRFSNRNWKRTGTFKNVFTPDPSIVGVVASIGNLPSAPSRYSGIRLRKGPNARYHSGSVRRTDYYESQSWSHADLTSGRWLSTPANGRAYQVGEELKLELGFNKPVFVVDGAPQLSLRFERSGDLLRRRADLVAQGDQTKMHFTYRITPEDVLKDWNIRVGGFDANGANVDDQLGETPSWDMHWADARFSEIRNYRSGSAQRVFRAKQISFVSAEASGREGATLDLYFTLDPTPDRVLTVVSEIPLSGESLVADRDYTLPTGPGGAASVVRDSAARVMRISTVVPAGAATGRIRVVLAADDDEVEPARESFTMSLTDSGDYVALGNPSVTVAVREGVCDRTPAVRSALTAASLHSSCEDVTNEDLLGTYKLDLSKQGITELRAKDFLGLDNLIALDLSDNQLETLPPGIFEGLARLGDDYGQLLLDGNPWGGTTGATFDFVVRVVGTEKDAQNDVEVGLHVEEGSPVSLEIPTELSGTLATDVSLSIGPGQTRGARRTLRSSGSERFELELEDGAWMTPPTGNCGRDACYTGFRFVKPPQAIAADPNLNDPHFTSVADPPDASVSRVGFAAPQYPGGYLQGAETIVAEVEFDQTVVVEASAAGDWPTLELSVGGQARTADYIVPVGAERDSTALRTLRFGYTLTAGDGVGGDIGVNSAESLQANGASVEDVYGRDADLSLTDFLGVLAAGGFQRRNLVFVGDSQVSVAEGATLRLPFTVAPAAWSGFNVGYEVVADTAGAADYAAGDGEVAVAAGATGGVIRIPITDDDEAEFETEWFRVRLSASGDYFLDPSRSETTVAIRGEGICDRTRQVREELMERLDADDCAAVTAEDLAGLSGELHLNDKGITRLKTGDFAGLTGTSWLYLHRNDLRSLPPGIFSGQESFTYIQMWGNDDLNSASPGAFSGISSRLVAFNSPYIRLHVDFEIGDNPPADTHLPVPLRVAVREGAPYLMRIRVNREVEGFPTASGSELVTIPAGATHSTAVEHSNLLMGDIRFSLTDESAPPDACAKWQRVGNNEANPCFGFTVVLGDDFILPQQGASSATPPICDRTPGIRDALLGLFPGSTCETFPAYLLATVTELDASSRGLTAVRGSDFNDLDALERLDLSANRLTTLPGDWAAGIKDTLKQLDLSDNDFRELPAGAFEGLTGLGDARGSLLLDANPDPDSPEFVFPVRLKVDRVVFAGEIEAVAYLPVAMPYDVAFTVDAVNITSNPDPSPIPAGSLEGASFSVARQHDSAPIALSVASVSQPPRGDSGCGYNPCYAGFGLFALDETLTYDGNRPAVGPRVVKVNFSTPRSSVSPSAPLVDSEYIAGGETIGVEVIFDKAVVVDASAGAPTLELNVGGRTRAATFMQSGSTNALALRFAYPLLREDRDTDGVGVRARDSLKLNGATIQDVFSTDAVLSLANFLSKRGGRVGAGAVLEFEAAGLVRVTEGETLKLGFRVAPPPLTPLIVGYDLAVSGERVRSGKAAGEDDYVYAANGAGGAFSVVSVPAGAAGGVIRIPIVADNLPEPAEFFTVRLLPSFRYLPGDPSEVEVRINEVGICDRTPQVRDVLVDLLNAADCSAVTPGDLAKFDETLSFQNRGMTGVKAGDFLGLSRANRLYLFTDSDEFRPADRLPNRLGTLPAGVFREVGNLTFLSFRNSGLTALPHDTFTGLSNLIGVDAGLNPGGPFELSLDLEYAADEPHESAGAPVPLRVVLREGAPYPVTVDLTATGGALSVSEATIPAGGTRSDLFTVTHTALRTEVTAANPRAASGFDTSNCLGWQQFPRDSGNCFGGLAINADDAAFLYVSSNYEALRPAADGDGEDADDAAIRETLRAPDPAVITGVELVSSPRYLTDGFVAGVETLELEVVFDEAVSVDTAAGTPSLTLNVGGNTRTAAYAPTQAPGGFTDRLRFRYPLDRDDPADADGFEVTGLRVNNAVIASQLVEVDLSSFARTGFAANGKVYRGTVLSFDDVSVASTEGSTFELRFRVAPTPRSALSLGYVVGEDDDPNTADASSADYDIDAGTVMFAAGASSATISISITDDTDIEPPREYFEVSLVRPPGNYFRDPRRSTVTVAIWEGVCDRTPPIPAELVKKIGSVSDCAEVDGEALAGVTGTLDLRPGETRVRINGLRVGDFSGLSRLGELRLNDNSLGALPAGLFAELGNLGTLRLNNSKVTEFSPGVFSGLGKLSWVTAHVNNLRELPAGLFAGVSKLKAISLSSNEVTFRLRPVFELAGDQPASAADPVPLMLTLREGAPYSVTAFLETSNATFGDGASTAAMVIPAGSTRSETAVTVTRTLDAAAVEVAFTGVSPQPSKCDWWQQIPQRSGNCFPGLEMDSGTGLVYAAATFEPLGVSHAEFTSRPRYSPDTYVAGVETISVDVTLSTEVTVDVSGGAPELDLNVGGRVRTATYVPPARATTARLSFRYALTAEDFDADGVRFESSRALRWNGAVIARSGGVFPVDVAPQLPSVSLGNKPEHKVRHTSVLSFDDVSPASTEGSTLELKFSVAPPPRSALRVRYVFGDDDDPNTADASSGADYPSRGGTVQVRAGAPGGVVRIRIADDTIIEPPREYFRVYLPFAGDDYFLERSTATVTIKEGVCDRTPQVAEALVAKTGAAGCAEVTSEGLAGAGGGVDLRQKEIDGLKMKDFSGLGGITSLDFRHNQLTALPPGVFDGLVNLGTLGLDHNDLSELPPGIFSDLGNLGWLPLNHNELQELPPNAFTGLRSLNAVKLTNNPGSNAGKSFPLRLRFELENGAPAPGDPVPARLTLREGAPYRLEVDLTAAGGTLSTAAAVIPAGSTQSDTFTLTRDATAGTSGMTITEVSPQPNTCQNWQKVGGRCFSGIEIVSDARLAFGEALARMTDVVITSMPANGEEYLGENAEVVVFEVTFDRAVDMARARSGNRPRLVVTIGRKTKYADCSAGSDPRKLVCRYTSETLDDGDIGVPANPLQLNGAQIFSSGIPLGDDRLRLAARDLGQSFESGAVRLRIRVFLENALE